MEVKYKSLHSAATAWAYDLHSSCNQTFLVDAILVGKPYFSFQLFNRISQTFHIVNKKLLKIAC